MIKLSWLTEEADRCCGCLLHTFELASCAMSPAGLFNFAAALPAAPAAVRLVFAGYRACSRLQQLRQQQQGRVPLKFQDRCVFRHQASIHQLVVAARDMSLLYSSAAPLQSSPSSRELLLSPDLLPCLAILLVVVALALGMSGGGGVGTAVMPATNNSSGPGSSSGSQPVTAGHQQQQAGSSDASSGVRLDSLAPLSCSLFDMLGVTKETALEAARLAKSEGLATPLYLSSLMSGYTGVLTHQVSYDQRHQHTSTCMLPANAKGSAAW